MKKYINKFLFATTVFLAVASCETDAEVVAPVKGEAGVIINVKKTSNGALLGVPEDGKELKDAIVTVTDAKLKLDIRKVFGSMSNDITKLEVYKDLNGKNPVKVAETTELPFVLEYETIDSFLEGTGKTATDLRIGDTFNFQVKVVKSDGSVYSYDQSMGQFSLTLNCSYDLTGTYIMKNSVCDNPQTVTISKNSDGSWYLSTVDGGLLQFCTSNTSLVNDGSINVGCGGVVDQASSPVVAFCGGEGGDYGIGCVTKGSWNQETGVLKMTHTGTFFKIPEYTSTYTRQ